MKNKKILLYSFVCSLVFLFGIIFNTASADTKCCIITEGSQCSNATTSQQIYDCAGTIIDGSCPSDCKSSSSSSGAASTASGSSATAEFPNPLGIKTVSEFLNKFLTSLRSIVAVVAIIFIVLGGILYMLSAGSEKMITRAKLCWTGAVIGLAIVLAAPSFLTEIINILGGSSGVNTAGLTGPTLYQIGVNILNLLLSIFGIIAIISLVVGGGMYLTAYGDEKRIETGKKIIVYAIIGIVVALSAVVIINEISSLISGQ